MITTERRQQVEVIRLDRPERRNGMVPEMMSALADQLRASARDPSVRGVVLTGSGASFCVGADLKWLAEQSDPGEAVAGLVAVHHQAVRAMREAPAPLIAAMNGAAAGGGLSLALAADYRIAGWGATVTAAYFRLGLTPDGGNSALLVRSIGAARAMELLVTNRSLSAEEARVWGLIGEVAPNEALVDRACAIAARLANLPAETLLATRRLLDSAVWQPLDQQLDAEAAAICEAARRDEFKTALAAFLTRASR
jgi:2-(1,2-epoxy-1,2-dihydrophenyl)acetyl-CoA isomerase